MSSVIVIGITSDIGRELAMRFMADGWTVHGTYRDGSVPASELHGAALTPCDLSSRDSVRAAIESLSVGARGWEVLVVAAGTEEPIGEFWDCDPDAWEQGIQINALSPLRLVRALYPVRNKSRPPSVAFFSGTGTNNAAPAYSSYCASKIFLIKMCELLDAESQDTSFFIIGPGIVRTKIHQQTLRVPDRGGSNYRKLAEFLRSSAPGTSHEDIYACLRWCMGAGKRSVGGRNISLVYDAWRNSGAALAGRLAADPDMYKLRRFGNQLSFAVERE